MEEGIDEPEQDLSDDVELDSAEEEAFGSRNY